MIASRPRRRRLDEIALLVGSGDRIALSTLPFVLAAVVVNIAEPAWFSVGGPPEWLWFASTAVLGVGLVVWAWSAALILAYVPRHRLITTGPFRVVKHPLYTAVALLVLPATGLLFDSWLGVPLGLVMYGFVRMYGPLEEQALATEFGAAWRSYAAAVWLRWL